MASFSAGQTVRVPFPYADRPIRAHRPALVVASPAAGEAPAVVWLLMITSAANAPWPGDVPIRGLARAGLPAASVVRTAKIACVDARQVEPIGRLGAVEWQRVVVELRQHLAAVLAE
jgi:mRNA interferase MazF